MAKISLEQWLKAQGACSYDRRRVLRLGRTVDDVVKAMRRPTVAQQLAIRERWQGKPSSTAVRRRYFNYECESFREWVALRIYRIENGQGSPFYLPWSRFARESRLSGIRKLADRLKALGVR